MPRLKTQKNKKKGGGDTVEALYINDWIALENIALHPFGKKYLLPLSEEDTQDPCILKSSEDCNDSNCTIYESTKKKKKCVSKRRIQRFEATEKAPIITGKNGKKYKLVSSKKQTIFFNDKTKKIFFDIYYHIFLSKHLYILFSKGYSSNEDEFTNIGIQNLLNPLVDLLIQDNNYLHSEQKIILCGHSLGCVLSFYTGMMILERNPDFFYSKIVIVGSAPFLFLRQDTNFVDLPNVKVFVYGMKINENITVVDPYINQGSTDLINYTPLTYILEIVEKIQVNDEKQHINDDNIKYEVIITKDIFETTTDKTFHYWSNYFEALKHLYPLDETKGGRRKNKRHFTRKSKNKN